MSTTAELAIDADWNDVAVGPGNVSVTVRGGVTSFYQWATTDNSTAPTITGHDKPKSNGTDDWYLAEGERLWIKTRGSVTITADNPL